MANRISSMICAVIMLFTIFAAQFQQQTVVKAEGGIAGLSEYIKKETVLRESVLNIDVNITIYSMSSGAVTAPSILYVMGHAMPRVGMESDLSIVSDFLNDGYTVVALDYNNSPKAVCPELDNSIFQIRKKIDDNTLFSGTSITHQPYKLYVVPAGYRLDRDIVYWDIKKHGSYGTLEYIMELYNSYIVPKFGKSPVTRPEDMENKDGSPIDYELKMDVIYPSQAVKDVPVMMIQASGSPRNYIESSESGGPRTHYIGFLMRGYTYVNYDHNYIPLARDDHYGYWDTYTLDSYNGRKSNTAAVRYMKMHADKYNINPDAIGVWGHSKAAYGSAVLSDPNHEGKPERKQFEGFPDGTPEPQPWQGYSSVVAASYQAMGNGTRWHNDLLFDDTVPLMTACGEVDPHNPWAYLAAQKANLIAHDIPHIVFSMYGIGHAYPHGYDDEFDLDRYTAVFDYFDRYLKEYDGIAPKVMYVIPNNDEKDVLPDSDITVKFAPNMDPDTINGLQVIRKSDDSIVEGTWTMLQRGSLFKWTPSEELEISEEYEIHVSADVKNTSGTALGEPFVSKFAVVNRQPVNQFADSVADAEVTYGSASSGGSQKDSNFGSETYLRLRNLDATSSPINWCRKSYIKFDISELSDSGYVELRFTTISGGEGYVPTNNVINVYGLLGDDTVQNWNEMTITWMNAPGNDTAQPGIIPSAVFGGDRLGYAINSKLKEYKVDVTDYIQSLSGQQYATFILLVPDKTGATDYILSKEGAALGGDERSGPRLAYDSTPADAKITVQRRYGISDSTISFTCDNFDIDENTFDQAAIIKIRGMSEPSVTGMSVDFRTVTVTMNNLDKSGIYKLDMSGVKSTDGRTVPDIIFTTENGVNYSIGLTEDTGGKFTAKPVFNAGSEKYLTQNTPKVMLAKYNNGKLEKVVTETYVSPIWFYDDFNTETMETAGWTELQTDTLSHVNLPDGIPGQPPGIKKGYIPINDRSKSYVDIPSDKQNSYIEAWFYDDLPSVERRGALWISTDNEDLGSIFVGMRSNASNYTCYFNSAHQGTAIPRATGWHKFAVDFTSGSGFRVLIDDEQVYPANGSLDTRAAKVTGFTVGTNNWQAPKMAFGLVKASLAFPGTESAGISISNVMQGDDLRMFVWDSLTNLKPLGNAPAPVEIIDPEA